MSPALRLDAIRYQYPRSDRPALDAVTFDVMPGERFAMLGPNGSGKTTLFRLLATLLPMQQGDAAVFGHDLRTRRHDVRRCLGVVFQQPSLDHELSAIENLTHHGRLYGLGGADLRGRIDQAVERFDLADFARRRTGRLSGGQQRRIELAKALLHRPNLLLMDEPTSGLDPAVRLNLWRLVDELRAADGLTVVVTTHLMDEADTCDRVAILHGGRLAALDTPEGLKARIGGQVFSVQPRAKDAAEVADALAAALPGVALRRQGGVIRFESDRGPALVGDLTQRLGDRLQRVSIGPPSLDDVFLHITGTPLTDVPHAEP